MTKRGRKSETLNLFEQYGGKHHQPDRLILFDDDSRNGPWLDALDAFDLGDKSELVALLKSGYPIPPAIAPHTGRIADAAKGAGYRVITADIVDRGYPGCRIQDFLKRRSAPPSVVGNPPFAIVEEFARHAFDIGADKVALIARTASIHAARWLRELPFSHAWLMTPRPSMPPGPYVLAGGKVGGGTPDFCWLVLERGYAGDRDGEKNDKDENDSCRILSAGTSANAD